MKLFISLFAFLLISPLAAQAGSGPSKQETINFINAKLKENDRAYGNSADNITSIEFSDINKILTFRYQDGVENFVLHKLLISDAEFFVQTDSNPSVNLYISCRKGLDCITEESHYYSYGSHSTSRLSNYHFSFKYQESANKVLRAFKHLSLMAGGRAELF